jgi:hypothetical protein
MREEEGAVVGGRVQVLRDLALEIPGEPLARNAEQGLHPEGILIREIELVLLTVEAVVARIQAHDFVPRALEGRGVEGPFRSRGELIGSIWLPAKSILPRHMYTVVLLHGTI